MRFGFAVLIPVFLTACNQADTPKTEAPADIGAAFAVNLDDYDRDLAGNIGLSIGQDGYEAEDVLRLFVSTAGTAEGGSYDISSTLEDGEKYLFGRALDLADDSVKSMEFLAVISINSDGTRTVKDYGARMQCWRAPDPTEWTTELCP